MQNYMRKAHWRSQDYTRMDVTATGSEECKGTYQPAQGVSFGTIWGQQTQVIQDNTIMHLVWLKNFEKSVVMTVSSKFGSEA